MKFTLIYIALCVALGAASLLMECCDDSPDPAPASAAPTS